MEKEKVKLIETGADFICAIETGGYARPVSWRTASAQLLEPVLVHLKGQPAGGARRFVKRLNEEMNLPVIVFHDTQSIVDCRIFASVAYGAI